MFPVVNPLEISSFPPVISVPPLQEFAPLEASQFAPLTVSRFAPLITPLKVVTPLSRNRPA